MKHENGYQKTRRNLIHQYYDAYLSEQAVQLASLCALRANTLETSVDSFAQARSREQTDRAVLHNSDKPPVAVAVVKQDHGVTLRSVGLAFDSRNERV